MKLAIKVDADTYLGTKIGVPKLRDLFLQEDVKASFFFSLGEDQMGRSLSRVFRKGFLRKCTKSNVLGNYPIRTLLSGTLLPSHIISRKCRDIIKSVALSDFECGIHCWNHYKWQNKLLRMSEAEVSNELDKAFDCFNSLGIGVCNSFASAGWQVSEAYLAYLDSLEILYASDSRGRYPFRPVFNGRRFNTIQIPTTLPTLDEILCEKVLTDTSTYYERQIYSNDVSVMTIHSELEGQVYFAWFKDFLLRLKSKGVEFIALRDYAKVLSKDVKLIPECDTVMSNFPNRSGLIAVQKG